MGSAAEDAFELVNQYRSARADDAAEALLQRVRRALIASKGLSLVRHSRRGLLLQHVAAAVDGARGARLVTLLHEEFGASFAVESRTKRRLLPLHVALDAGNEAVLAVLLRLTPAQGALHTSLLSRVAAKGAEAVSRTLAVAPDVDARSGYLAWTPLMCAVRVHNYDFAERLLRAGARATLSDRRGFTALHMAASCGFEDMVELLLRHVPSEQLAAFVNAKTGLSTSALWLAVSGRHAGIVRRLLEAAPPSQRALVSQKRGILSTLLTDARPACNVRLAVSRDGTVALRVVPAAAEDEQMARTLLRVAPKALFEPGSLRMGTSDMLPCVHCAISCGFVGLLQDAVGLHGPAVLAHRSPLNVEPLFHAVACGAAECLPILLPHVSLDTRGRYNTTLLHAWAAYASTSRAEAYRRILRVLLDAPATSDVEAADTRGWTPLCYAASRGNVFAIRELLAIGADPLRAFLRKRTPLWLAIRGSREQALVTMLARVASDNAAVGSELMLTALRFESPVCARAVLRHFGESCAPTSCPRLVTHTIFTPVMRPLRNMLVPLLLPLLGTRQIVSKMVVLLTSAGGVAAFVELVHSFPRIVEALNENDSFGVQKVFAALPSSVAIELHRRLGFKLTLPMLTSVLWRERDCAALLRYVLTAIPALLDELFEKHRGTVAWLLQGGRIAGARALIDVVPVARLGDRRTASKLTALHVATMGMLDDVVDALIRRGANLHELTPNGENVVHLAASVGSQKLVDKFIELGVNFRELTCHKNSAVSMALLFGHRDVATRLFDMAPSFFARILPTTATAAGEAKKQRPAGEGAAPPAAARGRGVRAAPMWGRGYPRGFRGIGRGRGRVFRGWARGRGRGSYFGRGRAPRLFAPHGATAGAAAAMAEADDAAAERAPQWFEASTVLGACRRVTMPVKQMGWRLRGTKAASRGPRRVRRGAKQLPLARIDLRGVCVWNSFFLPPIGVLAVRSGARSIVERVLAETECYFGPRGTRQLTLLHEASVCGDAALVDFLLRLGKFDVNALTTTNWTPLMFAVRSGSLRCTELLLRAGAQCVASPTQAENPVRIALRCGTAKLALLLLAHGAPLPDNMCVRAPNVRERALGLWAVAIAVRHRGRALLESAPWAIRSQGWLVNQLATAIERSEDGRQRAAASLQELAARAVALHMSSLGLDDLQALPDELVSRVFDVLLGTRQFTADDAPFFVEVEAESLRLPRPLLFPRRSLRVLAAQPFCATLRTLDLSDSPSLDDKTLIAFAASCPQLRSLAVNRCLALKGQFVRRVARLCRLLEVLQYDGSVRAVVDDRVIFELARSRTLRVLHIGGPVFATKPRARGFLWHLTLPETAHLEDFAVPMNALSLSLNSARFRQLLSNVRVLRITPMVAVSAILRERHSRMPLPPASLVTMAPNATEISLRHTDPSPWFLKGLMNAHPELVQLDVSYCASVLTSTDPVPLHANLQRLLALGAGDSAQAVESRFLAACRKLTIAAIQTVDDS